MLSVLARPSPTIDWTTLQVAVASVRADDNTILDVRVTYIEFAPVELTEDTMLAPMFITCTVPPPPPRDNSKRHRSSNTSEIE